jgi:hypothetical protein
VALLFGLLFESIKGRTGLHKGLVLGTFIVGITLPIMAFGTLSNLSSLPSIVFRAFQTIAFTAVLGAMFDAHALRPPIGSSGLRSRLREIAGVSSRGDVTAVGVAIASLVVVALSQAVQGRLAELFTDVISPIAPPS